MTGLLCLALAAASPAAAQDRVQDGPTAVIVFDNSGSMWGKIEGDKGNKLGVAREAVEGALDKLAPTVKTGLVTFGRRRGDCSDIELIAKPEPGDPDRITVPLDKLNPKGRGPIVQATRDAAKMLGASRPSSVILIHDDLDNCQQDPCAAAADIRREQPGLRVHVVSIGLKKEDLARMSCLAETTGGRHFDAQTATQLNAYIGESLALSGGEVTRPPPVPVPAARPALSSAAKPPIANIRRPTPPPAKGPSGLWLSAVLGSGGELVEAPVGWRVLKAGGDVETPVFEALASEVRAELPPGSYAVEARYGIVSARQPFEVAPEKPTAAVVTLNAGAMRAVARAQGGGPPIDHVTFAVFAANAPEARPAASPLWIGRDPAHAVGLPPGQYRLQAERGFARAQTSFTIGAGATTQQDIALGAGMLTLRAAAREDGETLADALFILFEDDPDAPQGRRELTRSAAAAPDFVLPAGTYTVTTRIGASEVRERVVVGAGESVKRTVILGLGRLTLNAKLEATAGSASATGSTGSGSNSGTAAGREPVTFRILRKDAEQREVARSGSNPYTTELPSGAYRVEALVGGQNARVTRDVELQAGRSTQLTLELPAARTTFKIAEAFASGGSADVSWEIRDEAGRLVWRGSQIEPRLVLAPGRYVVRATHRERRFERSIALRAGETRSVEMGPE